jgi:Family of unknown function (DUF5681)
MTRPPNNALSGNYKVGYGRPPSETRFRKGVTGNPGGRPRGMTAGRAKKLALQEAYRLITVREGDEVRTLPTIQAVMRSQARSAAKGNGPAQRDFIDRVQAIEEALQAAITQTESTQLSNITDEDRWHVVSEFLAERGYKSVPIDQDKTGKLGSESPAESPQEYVRRRRMISQK